MQRNGVVECSVCRSRVVVPSPQSMSRAYDKHRSKMSSKFRALNVFLIVGDCILVGLQPILVFMSKVDGKFQFSPVSVNFLMEVMNGIFAIVMLIIQSRKQQVGEKLLLARSTFIQCTKGHVSCSRCCTGYQDDEVECLMCREPEKATRCRAMEHILGGLHVPCPFRQHGCAEMIPYTSELAHKALCVHAPRHCPISGCAGYVGKPLREHVRQDHPGVVRTVVSPRCLRPLRMRAHEQARVVRLSDSDGDGGAEFLVVVGQYKELGRALSVVHLVDESVDEQDFKHRIEVVGKAGVLSLSGETLDAERLAEPYEASPFLFVPNETWDSPEGIRVFIELK